MKINNVEMVCPVCNKKLKRFSKVTDNTTLFICKYCSLRRLLPLPNYKNLKRLYGNEEYYSKELAELHDDLTKDYSNSSPIVKLYKRHLSCIEKYKKPPAKLLDVGCARGVFLDICRKSGFKVFGLEMNKYAYHYAKREFKLDVELSTIESTKFKKNSFDVITSFDVIEHVKQPNTFISKLFLLLRPGGIALIGTPNSSSLINKISELSSKLSKERITYPLYRFYGRGIEHLSIFNKNNMKKLVEDSKFNTLGFYDYSIPGNNITKIPLVLKPVIKLLLSIPYEFVIIVKKPENS